MCQCIGHDQGHRHVGFIDARVALALGGVQVPSHGGLEVATFEADDGFGAVARSMQVRLQCAFHDADQVVVGVVFALLVGHFQRLQLAQAHGAGLAGQQGDCQCKHTGS